MRDIYMDILIREAKIFHNLHARLLHAVHQVQTDDAALAVAFPDWKASPGEFGLLFRVLSPEHRLLEAYRNHIDKLVKYELVRLFPILPAPVTNKTVCFARDQALGKFSQAAARRRERRGNGGGIPMQRAQTATATHWLRMQSSRGNEFRMVIRKTSTERQGGRQYGLGLLVPDF
jgi:uncharacterized protein YfaA (DUF2138 family)